MRGFLSAIFFVIAILSLSFQSHAITIDRLETAQQVTTTPPSSGTVSSQSTIIGGVRYVEVQRLAGSIILSNIELGLLSHSQNASTRGSSFYLWDGNALAGIQPNGLGGVNFLGDNGSAIRITVNEFDFPNNQPIFLNFTIYDASDPSGTQKVSKATLAIDRAVSPNAPQTFDLPFSNFQNAGAEAASFFNVGAISLLIDGTGSPAHDLDISFVGTNGRCSHVPQNKLVVDQCGVCAGDNSSCSDCEGAPNGRKVAGTECSTGKLGACGLGTYTGKFPACGCNQNSQPTNEICDNVDNNCNGSIDEGLGKGSSCSVGVGACLRIGANACGSNGSVVCTAVAGTPGAESCDGIDNDCDGSIDEGALTVGPKIDACGVCNGDGSSCKDCKGVTKGTAKVDACGVCGGNGSSCCTTTDLSPTLTALDVGAKEQEMVVKNTSALLKAIRAIAPLRKEVNAALKETHTLQLRNWALSWNVPVLASSCPGESACTTVNNLGILDEYRANNVRLHAIASALLNQTASALNVSKITGRRLSMHKNRHAGLVRWNERLFADNAKRSYTVPVDQLVCK